MPIAARPFVAWLLVMAGAAVALKVLDHVPTLIAGTPRGVRVYRSIEEAERALSARIWMPGYYPDELRWPPLRIELAPTRPPAVAVRIASRDGDPDRLAVVEAMGPGAPPPVLLPAGETMETSPVVVGGGPAVLSRVLLGTRELHDLSWSQGGRSIVLRYAGPVDRLLLIAGSLERRARETGSR
jgi:hypothetical protein